MNRFLAVTAAASLLLTTAGVRMLRTALRRQA